MGDIEFVLTNTGFKSIHISHLKITTFNFSQNCDFSVNYLEEHELSSFWPEEGVFENCLGGGSLLGFSGQHLCDQVVC